ncbi:MAG: glycosyltransferase [Thaumarchaeota archaeon]|nr:glycosyltransferase [Nitrososphaerota archaeon]
MSIAIVTHVFASGPAQELEEYLKQKVDYLLFLGHPFVYSKQRQSFKKSYSKGQESPPRFSFAWQLSQSLSFLKDMFYTFWWVLTSKKKYHLYVGADSLNALCGVILKKIGIVEQVVFYSVDFVPIRFHNKLLNAMYHRSEAMCVEYCDEVWNLSERMATARERMHIVTSKSTTQIVVPIGVYFERIQRYEINQIDRFKLVYLGHLRKGQGLELIIKCLPEIFETWPYASLVIVGTGPMEDGLLAEVRKMGCTERVEFKGYVEDHRIVEQILSKCGIGLALYEPKPDSFSWYADPSKPKQYMACGLPVIITGVPAISSEIEIEGAGIIVEYEESDFMKGLHILLDDVQEYTKARERAILLASRYGWKTIFENTLNELIRLRQLLVK